MIPGRGPRLYTRDWVDGQVRFCVSGYYLVWAPWDENWPSKKRVEIDAELVQRLNTQRESSGAPPVKRAKATRKLNGKFKDPESHWIYGMHARYSDWH